MHQTASEPLTLDEEYAMQRIWDADEDKCTFIILRGIDPSNGAPSEAEEIAAMIGDVNIFLNNHDDRHVGEIEIMIAEEDARGAGNGIRFSRLAFVLSCAPVNLFIATLLRSHE